MKHLIEFALIGLALLAVAGLVMGSSSEHDEDGEHGYRSSLRAPAFEPYQTECGSCHLAYPPGLLPARSWEALMDGLADHFGDNAELPAADAAAIRDYLVGHAGDRRVRGDRTPLRITETRYFRHKHDEVPPRLVRDNPEVGSFSNCQACHRKAEAGSFDEHTVNIPGYGRWDD
jgi:hypothetical protein